MKHLGIGNDTDKFRQNAGSEGGMDVSFINPLHSHESFWASGPGAHGASQDVSRL